MKVHWVTFLSPKETKGAFLLVYSRVRSALIRVDAPEFRVVDALSGCLVRVRDDSDSVSNSIFGPGLGLTAILEGKR